MRIFRKTLGVQIAHFWAMHGCSYSTVHSVSVAAHVCVQCKLQHTSVRTAHTLQPRDGKQQHVHVLPALRIGLPLFALAWTGCRVQPKHAQIPIFAIFYTILRWNGIFHLCIIQFYSYHQIQNFIPLFYNFCSLKCDFKLRFGLFCGFSG